MNYATLTELRDYLHLAASETADDAILARFLSESSRFIDRNYRDCGIHKETKNYDYPGRSFSRFGVYSLSDWISEFNRSQFMAQGKLRFDADDLLEPFSVTNGDGSAVALSDVDLFPANDLYPKHGLYLKHSSGLTWQIGSGGDWRQVIAVNGLWGYHSDYSNSAWIDSLDTTEDNPLSTGATQITVNFVEGSAFDGESPRFQIGQLLRLGSGVNAEFVLVTDVNPDTNKLTVQRGVNGTTAAQWAQNTAISIFRSEARLATIRLCAWRYRQKDANVFDKTVILGTGIAITPASIPADVSDLLPLPYESLAD
jgi:hypothetical protein